MSERKKKGFSNFLRKGKEQKMVLLLVSHSDDLSTFIIICKYWFKVPKRKQSLFFLFSNFFSTFADYKKVCTNKSTTFYPSVWGWLMIYPIQDQDHQCFSIRGCPKKKKKKNFILLLKHHFINFIILFYNSFNTLVYIFIYNSLNNINHLVK